MFPDLHKRQNLIFKAHDLDFISLQIASFYLQINYFANFQKKFVLLIFFKFLR